MKRGIFLRRDSSVFHVCFFRKDIRKPLWLLNFSGFKRVAHFSRWNNFCCILIVFCQYFTLTLDYISCKYSSSQFWIMDISKYSVRCIQVILSWLCFLCQIGDFLQVNKTNRKCSIIAVTSTNEWFQILLKKFPWHKPRQWSWLESVNAFRKINNQWRQCFLDAVEMFEHCTRGWDDHPLYLHYIRFNE